MTKSIFKQRICYTVIGLIVTIVVWYMLTIPLKAFLPTPHVVLENIILNILTFETYYHIWLTMRRILIGFIGALLLGISLGIRMGNKKISESFFLPWVIVALAVPGPVAII